MRVPRLRPSPEAPPELASKTLVAILGMHRSGTSAVAGMLADHGLEFGPVRERNRFNRRGNRELPELNELHDALLGRAGGTWWAPPADVPVRAGDLRRRNRIIAGIAGDVVAVKDPRMLVCPKLWNDLELKPIGVIRNPVAVRSSLAHRAAERPEKHPQLSAREWEDVWLVYNRALLDRHRRSPFPLVDFDRPAELQAQLTGALGFWGLDAGPPSDFFDPDLASPGDGDWTAEVESPEALELWRTLAGIAAR
jgi:hypothetical protein